MLVLNKNHYPLNKITISFKTITCGPAVGYVVWSSDGARGAARPGPLSPKFSLCAPRVVAGTRDPPAGVVFILGCFPAKMKKKLNNFSTTPLAF